MSRLVPFLMLLSLMVMVVVVAHPGNGCPAGWEPTGPAMGPGTGWKTCVPSKGKREALDGPMTHKTKRGEFIV